jgi:predicted nucleic acid-binding protein
VARIAVDSNILIYAEGTDDPVKRQAAIALIGRIGHRNIALPMQAAGETLRWMIKRGGFERRVALERLAWWLDRCEPLAVSVEAFRLSLRLVEDHAFQLWDAVIVAASTEAGAAVLLSEDMQHGFRWRGITIVNPFVLEPSEMNFLLPGRSIH